MFSCESYYLYFQMSTRLVATVVFVFPPPASTPGAIDVKFSYHRVRKEKEALMRVQHLNKSARLLFKMLQLFSRAELAPVARGGTSNHLDMTVLNLAQFWSISRTAK